MQLSRFKKSEAPEALFHRFNSSVPSTVKTSGYRFPAADGSTFTFFSKPSFSSPEYFVSQGHSVKGFYSMHLNAFYDLQKHTYSDALIQPVHLKDEFRASVIWLTGTTHCRRPGMSLLVTGLAYVGVISYNKKNLERELQNESRQHNRQQNLTK